MTTLWMAPLLALFVAACAAPSGMLPPRYHLLMEAELSAIASRLDAEPGVDLRVLEEQPHPAHLASVALTAAVLYSSSHPANASRGSQRWLILALRVGDVLVNER